MTAIEFLRQYEYASLKADNCREQYEETIEKIDAIQSALGKELGMPKNTGTRNRTEQLVEQLSDMARKWIEAEKEAEEVKAEVYAVIDQIKGCKGHVLYERYIRLNGLGRVADILCYSVSNIYKLHAQAIDDVEIIIKEQSKRQI